jgi:hypothetical protein
MKKKLSAFSSQPSAGTIEKIVKYRNQLVHSRRLKADS